MPTRTLPALLTLLERNGVMLESAHGPVPSLAEAIAGEPLKGGWWSHPQGSRIFNLLNELREQDAVLVFRLVDAKVTYVHQRCWPALVRIAPLLPPARVAALRHEHTERGSHRSVDTPFPVWVRRASGAAAEKLSVDAAVATLGPWAGDLLGLKAEPAAGTPRRRAKSTA